jgi:hypothetical protein
MAVEKTVLVTGGAGYIGSHAVLQLLLAGFRAVVVDNLHNSTELAVRRVAALAGDHARNLSFHRVSECAPCRGSPRFPFPLEIFHLPSVSETEGCTVSWNRGRAVFLLFFLKKQSINRLLGWQIRRDIPDVWFARRPFMVVWLFVSCVYATFRFPRLWCLFGGTHSNAVAFG